MLQQTASSAFEVFNNKFTTVYFSVSLLLFRCFWNKRIHFGAMQFISTAYTTSVRLVQGRMKNCAFTSKSSSKIFRIKSEAVNRNIVLSRTHFKKQNTYRCWNCLQRKQRSILT